MVRVMKPGGGCFESRFRRGFYERLFLTGRIEEHAIILNHGAEGMLHIIDAYLAHAPVK